MIAIVEQRPLTSKKLSSGQSYKAPTIVIYDYRVIPYDRKLFIRLATENISQEKLTIFTPLQKLSKNVGNLCKIIVAKH